MFLRSMFAFQFLPLRQVANLLSEAIPKASPEDINSPSPSRSAAVSASLETFLGAAPEVRESIHPATPGDPSATHPRVGTGPQPGSNPSQEMSAPSPRASSLGEDLAGACRAALSGQLGSGHPVFSEEVRLSMWVPAWPCQLARRSEDGRPPAVVAGTGMASGSSGAAL